jgi:hypothetical protein
MATTQSDLHLTDNVKSLAKLQERKRLYQQMIDTARNTPLVIYIYLYISDTLV